MAKRSKKRRKNPMASLTDDLVVDILARLPIKSLCRCKGVSRHWRDLICHEDHRRKLSQTLPGLFYRTVNYRRFPKETRHFTHVWEASRLPLVCPSLSFLRGFERISIVDCCNGILLCRFSESNVQDAFRYVVCNPAERRFVFLPDSGCGADERVTCLAFDPALYPEFHVLEFVDNDYVEGVNIYSFETRAWKYKESGWCRDAVLYDDARCVFYNGFMNLISRFSVLAVDVEGERWSMIPLPDDAYPSDGSDYGFLDNDPGFIGTYKGHLCYITEPENSDDVSIWILEDYVKDDWVKKCQVSVELLCEKQISQYKCCYCKVIGILPGSNFMLYVAGRDNTLMAYDIDREEVHAIQNLGQDCWPTPLLYVPFYRE